MFLNYTYAYEPAEKRLQYLVYNNYKQLNAEYRGLELIAKKTFKSRAAFIQKAKIIDANELELAATAAFIYAVEGIGNYISGNPWAETKRRKPEKATEARLLKAFQAYESLRQLNTPKELPPLPSP